MDALRFHTPLKGKTREREFVAFDVEGVGGKGGFWLGGVFDSAGGKSFTDQAAFWGYLTDSQRGDAWRVAHNLEYDLSVAQLGVLFSGGALMGEGGLLWVDTQDSAGNQARFVDSLNLFRGLSVREIGLMVGLPKLELPGGFLEVLRYGYPFDYFSQDEKDLLVEYNLRDAEIVYRAMNFLQAMVNELGGELRETIAGTSHDLYRRVYMPHAWPTIGPNTNDCAREAFYGGRVEPYRMGTTHGVSMYDINSLYPHIMKVERFPHPGSLDIDTRGTLPSDLDRREGVIACSVTVPEMYCPPLPARVAGGLFFPVGSWSGVFTLNELRHALDCGVSVERVEWMISTRNLFNPFSEFVQDLWKKREELAISNTHGATVVKMLLNAHIGRYGVRSEPPLTTFEIVDDLFDPVADQGLICDRLGPYDYLERPVGNDRTPTYANVLFAAQVNAGARVFMHEHMVSQGNDLIYSDTDCMVTRRHLETGSGLGKWKCQLLDGSINLIGPKEYACMIENKLALVAAKGVPAKVAAEYIRNGAARYQKALSLRQAKIGNMWPGSWVEVYQQRGSPIPKRDPAAVNRSYTGPVKTKAWDYSQLVLEAQVPARYRAWKP